MNSLIIWFNACVFWGLGIGLCIHTVKFWNDSRKKPYIISEMLLIGLFGIMGYYTLILFENLSEFTIRLHFYQLLLKIVLISFFLANVLPNYFHGKITPEFRNDLSYGKFLADLRQQYDSDHHSHKKDVYKDVTRKILHLFQFTGYIVTHFVVLNYQGQLNDLGINPIEFRNYLYLSVGSVFWIMMLIGDITRIESFRSLPKWAFCWYSSSLEIDREAWTVNSVIPILLANCLWIHPIFPTEVFFIAIWVSCISDAVASFVGKNFGIQKWGKLSPFPKKSKEGTIAGILTTIIGILVILLTVPNPTPPLWYLCSVPLGCAIIFFMIDVYGKGISDNLLNSILIGTYALICTYLV